MRKVLIVLALLILLAGIGVFVYPHVQQFLYTRHARAVIADFEERLEGYRAESEDGTLRWLNDMMAEYNEHLYKTGQAGLVDAFSLTQVSFSLQEFGFEEDMIGYIYIPRMNIELPIYLGASEENMYRGAAHLTQTSLPVGGENHNAVIAAHRGFRNAAMFRDIELLELGDDIFITNFYQTLRYQVVETRIIIPTQVNTVLIQSGRDLVTLVTCHPYRHNFQRFVVFAERVED
ncbi:MAG: class C sortase [Oscillospiraceae bacterium]|nr:class C sortase [Oscillospiraceae bacterium]